jgi:hypothetical protein
VSDLTGSEYGSEILQKGGALIKNSHPDAKNFRSVFIKDFIDGKLIKIEFDITNNSHSNYVYDQNGKMSHFRDGEHFFACMGATERRPGIVEMILRPNNVAAIIAIFLLVFIAVLVYRQAPLPDIISQAFTLALGFFLGNKSSGQDQSKP